MNRRMTREAAMESRNGTIRHRCTQRIETRLAERDGKTVSLMKILCRRERRSNTINKVKVAGLKRQTRAEKQKDR